MKEARDSGAKVIDLESATAPEGRRMPLTLVLDPKKDLKIMTEEIFGPILPIIPYDTLESAVDEVNAGARPLGLYIFSDVEKEVAFVVNNTRSGGLSVNACAIQAALPSLGFGGSGNSGMGRHHGLEGFREFSNPRGIFRRGTDPDLLAALCSSSFIYSIDND